MSYWLVKEEPAHYGFTDLERDRRVSWTGVHNALAQRHLKAMRPGDLVLYYHTGEQRTIVGIAEVTSEPMPDPADPRGAYAVDMKPVRPLKRPVPLAEIRAEPALAALPLVRISRLSVMPVTAYEWKRIDAMSKRPASAASGRS